VDCETPELCFDFRRVKDSFLVQIAPDISRIHPASCSMVPEALAPGLKRRGKKLTTHIYLVQKLGMSGTIAILPVWLHPVHSDYCRFVTCI